MSIKLTVPISIHGDRELKGTVNETLFTHYFSKVLQPAAINLIRLDASTGAAHAYKIAAPLVGLVTF